MVDDIATINRICEYDTFIGNSMNHYDILVLRKPTNLFASRYHFRSGMPADAQRWERNESALWLNHAREYLDMTC